MPILTFIFAVWVMWWIPYTKAKIKGKLIILKLLFKGGGFFIALKFLFPLIFANGEDVKNIIDSILKTDEQNKSEQNKNG